MCYYIKEPNCINRKNKEVNDIYIQNEIIENEILEYIKDIDDSYLHIFKVTISLFLYFFVMTALSNYFSFYLKEL